jgi:YD repeat-containing protein
MGTALAPRSPPPALHGLLRQRASPTRRTHRARNARADRVGNRTNTGYDTDPNNRLASDGVYDYEYDSEGNRTRRTRISDGTVTEYTWDHRNRLTKVTELDELGGNVTKEVDYQYDVNERLVGKILDPDGEGEEEATEEYYAYDQTPFSTRENASQMLFRFEGSEVSDLKSRYLWAPVVDLLLSEEKLTGPSTPGDIYWALGDNLNTVRDIARYNPATDTTTIVNHRVFDAFGNITDESNSAVDLVFAFTGRL